MKSWFHALRRHAAFVIATVYSPAKWYRVAYLLSGWMVVSRSQSTDDITNSKAFNRAWKLNSLLAFLTRKGQPFPIPIKACGIDIFKKERPNGLVICSTHLPLVKVAMRHLAENYCKPDYAIAADISNTTEAIALWGTTDTIPVIRTGLNVLIKAKSLLQKGYTVAALVDTQLGASISPNLFKLANRVGADVVFFFAELATDGTVHVNFVEANSTGSSIDEVVNNQMAILHRHTNAILERYQSPHQPASQLQPSFQL